MNDRSLQLRIGRLLQCGVAVAAVLAVAGGCMLLVQGGGQVADFREFTGAPAELRGPAGIVRAARALDSRAIIQLGIFVLIATPVARVGLSLAVFIARRDRMYAVLTAVVLSLLVGGLLFGR